MTAEEIIIEINKLMKGSITEIDLRTFQRKERHDFTTRLSLSLTEPGSGHVFKADSIDDVKTVLSSLHDFTLEAEMDDLSKNYQPGQPVFISVIRELNGTDI